MNHTVIRCHTSPWRALRRWLTERNLFRQIRAAEFELSNLKAERDFFPTLIKAREQHLEELVKAVQRNRLS